MKVSELISRLEQCGSETDVRIGWSSVAVAVLGVEPESFVNTGDGTTQITLLLAAPPPSQTEFDRVLLERDQALRDKQALTTENTKLTDEVQRWTARLGVLQDRLNQITAIAVGRQS